ncbi:MAG: cupin domain-containing protein [Gammaproteobacteria bacterium]|jgi:50S ribosomal protein L16 3-hydroxylase
MMRWPPGLDADRFLAEYWQRKPLYLPGALIPWTCPLSPEELAGLACEAEVESRIATGDESTGWTLRHGPFEEEDFVTAPEEGWTLLVQDVEKHLPELRPLMDRFDFIPPWRMDDLMISFAAPGGSVGPHVDAYDVFLIQGQGTRTWGLDPEPGKIAWREDSELRVLDEFSPGETLETVPGDVLYLPPGIAHYGIGADSSITLSIGFRAPSAGELLAAAGALLDQQHPDLRYGDSGLARHESDGVRISDEASARASALLQQVMPLGDGLLDEALGRLVTGNKPWLLAARPIEPTDPEQVAARLAAGDRLGRAATARFAWRRRSDGEVLLFADGQSWCLGPAAETAARALCEAGHLDQAGLADDDTPLGLLTALLEQGSLEWIGEHGNSGGSGT